MQTTNSRNMPTTNSSRMNTPKRVLSFVAIYVGLISLFLALRGPRQDISVRTTNNRKSRSAASRRGSFVSHGPVGVDWMMNQAIARAKVKTAQECAPHMPSSCTKRPLVKDASAVQVSLEELCQVYDSYPPLDKNPKYNGLIETDVLQKIFFRQALQEECWPTQTIQYNHEAARVSISPLPDCTFGVQFPRSLVSYCLCGGVVVAPHEKKWSYYFSGWNNTDREWIFDYADQDGASVEFNGEGRTIRKATGTYDWHYYDQLKQSRFALAPDGDFGWTYRFLEAIMCGAIPILGRTPQHFQEKGYQICIHGEPCPLEKDEQARQEAAQENWKLFVRRHSLMAEVGKALTKEGEAAY